MLLMQKFVEDVCKLWDFLTKKERIEGINEEKSDFFHKPKIIYFVKKNHILLLITLMSP